MTRGNAGIGIRFKRLARLSRCIPGTMWVLWPATLPSMSTHFILCALAAAALLATRPAQADESAPPSTSPPGTGIAALSWSAFGTIGAARSNRSWRYQRFIRDDASLERDSVLGGQAELQLSPEWSATVQGKLAPSDHSDTKWELVPAWAFVAWRPDNDWLLRAGKLRVPFLLRSEQLDVGQTYDEARLPAEIYALPPTSDFKGAAIAHTWSAESGDLSLDGYYGSADLYKRFWIRAALPSPVPGADPVLPAGAMFKKVNVSVTGLVLSWREPTLVARAGLHRARTRRVDGGEMTVRPAWLALGPGLGYWQTSGAGAEQTSRIRNDLLTLGADAQFGGGWRLAGEYLRLWQRDTELGVDGWAGYATLYRSLGAFTPYLTYAISRTSERSARWQRELDGSSLPGMIPGAGLLTASMRANADTVPVYRQQSVALGSSYALTTTQKIKAEWLHTRATESLLIDVPVGEPLARRRSVDVLSLSYSFVF